MTHLISTCEEITSDWLTAVLRHAGVLDKSGKVDHLDEPVRIGSGQLGSAYAVTPQYSNVDGSAPKSLVVKLPAVLESNRVYARSAGSYDREVFFYQQVAPILEARVPQCYYAEIANDGERFCLVLEDLSPVTTCNQLTGCSVEQAGVALKAAAAMHASTWQHKDLQRVDWLYSGNAIWKRFGDAAPATQEVFRSRYGSMLDDSSHEVASRLQHGYAARLMQTLDEPRCLWHGDFRLDNLLFDGQAGKVPVAVVDWQSVTLAPGSIDASYFIGAGLTTEVRRTSEDALLRLYHQSLVEGGVSDYSWESCLTEYRINTLFGFLVAMVASVGTSRSEHADKMFTTMANRHAAHILDNDAFTHLDAVAMQR